MITLVIEIEDTDTTISLKCKGSGMGNDLERDIATAIHSSVKRIAQTVEMVCTLQGSKTPMTTETVPTA
jgi:hypothetical protein